MKQIKLIMSLALVAAWGTLFSQTLVVTDDPAYTTGHPSSVLDVKSSTKGMLAPSGCFLPRFSGSQCLFPVLEHPQVFSVDIYDITPNRA